MHTVYANTNMAGIGIVCPIYTVILGGAWSDPVAWWLACHTLEPVDQGRFLGGHLLYIIVFFFSQLYNNELLPKSNMNWYKWQKVHSITFYIELSSKYVG